MLGGCCVKQGRAVKSPLNRPPNPTTRPSKHGMQSAHQLSKKPTRRGTPSTGSDEAGFYAVFDGSSYMAPGGQTPTLRVKLTRDQPQLIATMWLLGLDGEHDVLEN